MNLRSCNLLIVLLLVVSPALAADTTSPESDPWYWYNKAVDLANEGKFSEALTANERALSINGSMPVAWANQAGILVQLHRYDDAITAADRVFAFNSSELPNTFAAAYYSKGDAFRALGKTAEARDLYAKAYALDNTLVPPDLSRDTVPTTTPRSPLFAFAAVTAIACAIILFVFPRKTHR